MYKIKVALYVRLSQEDKYKNDPDDNSESIKNQIVILTEKCQKENWDIYDIYNDDDFSGADRNRPEFNRMIDDAREHRFDVVLCKTQSRFCRDIELVEKYINYLFPAWKIRFISIVDNSDSENRQNRKARQITGLIDQWYLEDISENVKTVLAAKRKKGEWLCHCAPYGYKKSEKDKHKLVVDEPAAAVVRRIYELYLSGMGVAMISNALTTEKVLTPRVYKKLLDSKIDVPEYKEWSVRTVNTILSNEIYIGNTVQGKSVSVSYKGVRRDVPQSEWDVVLNTHEPIIQKDDFEKVQSIKKIRTVPYRHKHSPSVFSRICFCMNCGKPLYRKFSSKNINCYLSCSSKKTNKNSCIGVSISEKKMLNIVLDSIKSHCSKLLNMDEVKLPEKSIVQQRIQSLEIIITEAEKEKEKLKKRNAALYIDKIDGIISTTEWKEYKDSIDNEYNLAEGKMQNAKLKLEIAKEELISMSKIKDIVNQYINSDVLDRTMLESFVDKINVGGDRKDKKVEIRWKF